jgi:hypothetical protein
MIARRNLQFQWLAVGSIHSFLAIKQNSLRPEVHHKKTSPSSTAGIPGRDNVGNARGCRCSSYWPDFQSWWSRDIGMGRLKSKRAMDPVTAGTQMVQHQVSLSLKYMSRVTCISGGRVFLIPYIVSLRASEPVQRALTDTGLQLSSHLVLQQRTKAYFNRSLFRDYAQ